MPHLRGPIHPFLSMLVLNDPAMDMSLITAIMGAQTGMTQLAVATSLERMNANQGASVVKLIDSAQQNISALANVGAGIGGNLDISA
jgi:hypothetical protein